MCRAKTITSAKVTIIGLGKKKQEHYEGRRKKKKQYFNRLTALVRTILAPIEDVQEEEEEQIDRTNEKRTARRKET